MEKLADALQNIILSTQLNALFLLQWISVLWLIHLINVAFRYRLSLLGVYPRTWRGLLGIIFAPFLHVNFKHLLINTLPLFFLGDMVLANGQAAFYSVTVIIIVLGEFLTWIFGRKRIHIGSSELVMGYFGYLLANAYYHFNVTTVLLAILCLYYFGGLVIALVPEKKEVSWESHVFGFIAGIVAAYGYSAMIIAFYYVGWMLQSFS